MLRFVIMCLGAFLIGLSKAGFGGGTGMIVAPLLALVMPPKLGLGLMLPLLLATDMMALVHYRGQWDRRSVAVLLPPAVLGIGLGGYLLRLIPSDLLARLIGLLALGFSSVQLWQARHPLPAEKVRLRPWLGATLGFVAGLTSTVAHLGGLLTTIYLLPQQLGPAGFVATSTVIFLCMNAVKLPAYSGQGLLPPEIWHQAASLLPALAAGAVLGFVLNGRVTPRRFNSVVIWIVLATGLYLLIRSSPHAPASGRLRGHRRPLGSAAAAPLSEHEHEHEPEAGRAAAAGIVRSAEQGPGLRKECSQAYRSAEEFRAVRAAAQPYFAGRVGHWRGKGNPRW